MTTSVLWGQSSVLFVGRCNSVFFFFFFCACKRGPLAFAITNWLLSGQAVVLERQSISLPLGDNPETDERSEQMQRLYSHS